MRADENQLLTPGPVMHLDLADETTGRVFTRALGAELRRVREARGWSRAEFVELLPSRIGERTLMSYEHGARQLYVFRLVELCQALGTDASTVLVCARQRARLHLESLPLQIDLNALLSSSRKTGTYRPLAQWTRNTLNEHPSGVVMIESAVVHNLALFMGCTHHYLAKYLARFVPDEINTDEPESTLVPE